MLINVEEGEYTHDNGPFGHHGARMGNGFIDTWGLGPLLLRYRGKTWRFEHSNMFGPAMLTVDGNISDRQPVSESHPFWAAFSAWQASGMRHRPIRNRRGRLKYYLCWANGGKA